MSSAVLVRKQGNKMKERQKIKNKNVSNFSVNNFYLVNSKRLLSQQMMQIICDNKLLLSWVLTLQKVVFNKKIVYTCFDMKFSNQDGLYSSGFYCSIGIDLP